MTDVRDRIDRVTKRDEAETRKVVEALGDAVKSAEEQTREVARQAFDRIKAARDAHRRKAVKKTD
jgi:hypothetical protein